ncbi:alpha-protein kinase 2 [Pholidichthys leucotaenia]
MKPFSCHSLGSENGPATPSFSPLSPQSEGLGCDVAVAPITDLYIFESDTQDFALNPTACPPETKCPEHQIFTYQSRGQTDYDCDPRSSHIVTECLHSSSEERVQEIHESDVSQGMGLSAPAADAQVEGLMPVNDAGGRKEEMTSLTPQHDDSPNELWLDACQYLPGEDTEDWNVLDKTAMQRGVSDTSPSSFLSRDTKVSGYNPDGSEGIGWSSDDKSGQGPPVKRWSSVDSWASALSDWTGIIAAPLEDFTAAFTEIGAEIDALTQALPEVNTETEVSKGRLEQTHSQLHMGVQDQPLTAQSIPEGSTHSRQRHLSLCLEAARPEPHDRGRSQEYFPISSGDVSPTPLTTSSTNLDFPNLSGSATSLEADIFTGNEGDQIILSIIEDTDLGASAELLLEPCGDGQHKLTDECRVLEPGSTASQSCKRAEVDVEGNKLGTDLDILTPCSQTDSRVPGLDTQPGGDFNDHAHVKSDISSSLDGASWAGDPASIMHVAPLSLVPSFVCRTSSSLEGDQTLNDNGDLSRDHVQHCAPWSTPDGITGKASLEGGEELIHKKPITINTAGESSPEGLQDFNTESFLPRKTIFEEISREFENLAYVATTNLFISEENRIACITFDLNDPFVHRAVKQETIEKMPHKTHKSTSEGRTRSKRDKLAAHHHGAQANKKQDSVSHHKKQETLPVDVEIQSSENAPAGIEAKEAKLVIETGVATEKGASKTHGKKKKKYGQNAATVEPLTEVENGARSKSVKARSDMFETKLGTKPGKAQKDGDHKSGAEKKSQRPEVEPSQGERPPDHTGLEPKSLPGPLKDDVIKKPRLSENKFGKIVSTLDSKLPKSEMGAKTKGEALGTDVGGIRKKAYSEVVKQKVPPQEEIKVVQPIQAAPVSGDPQSLSLWCQFAAVSSDYTVTWSKEGTVLAELKRIAGDESRMLLTIANASHKDLGKYQCHLSCKHGSVNLEYVLTYEVLSEIVIPLTPKIISSAPVEVSSEEEDAHCSRLMFKEDFLSEQYFGENQPISIITEKVHFGEGMHRRAFRTKLQAGQIPLLVPGHPCVLKVHNSISYGTKSNDELVQKNFSLAVEECQVQNTAREYIKAYTAAAQSVEAFGDVPEIIPIYLIHRPSSNIPYATLEEMLIGDFVKYSVKDGKEINLMRRDSEAGQKCCAFQHWVYQKTEGNLLVTDMQGVGMRLTDVGIATCKKGYKGFKGNCATSFIDQFKALHQCNKYCELLGLKSLQPKAKKSALAPKPKAPGPSAAPKKKTFGPTAKGKS